MSNNNKHQIDFLILSLKSIAIIRYFTSDGATCHIVPKYSERDSCCNNQLSNVRIKKAITLT